MVSTTLSKFKMEGKASSSYTKELVTNRLVELKGKTDQASRDERRQLNEILVNKGWT